MWYSTVLREIPTGFFCPELDGKYFLVTGTGKYFKNVQYAPAVNLGLVVWAQHGIYGAGKDLDETFGLIETAEKAAEIYMKIAHLPLVNTITDDEMHQLETHFGVKAREGYLQ